MKLEFLWDEEKTRKLFRTHLILFLIGGVIASIYAFILPSTIPYRPVVLLIPTTFTASCFIYFWLLPWPNPGFRFLIFTLEAQLMASIFMAVTGGFLGIVQFAPYMFLLFAVFELGTQAALILGSFSILTFVAILLWYLSNGRDPNVVQNFFYFVGSYILIMVIEHNLGRELSLQFEARRRLEQIDDLKNQFITLTSHYLRTPLTIIKYFIAQEEKSATNKEQQIHISQITASVRNLENLVEKLLTISSIEKGQARVALLPSDLNNLLSEVIAEFTPLALRQRTTLSYKPPVQPIPRFTFDPVKLKETLSSLIDNAIKYNRPCGLVIISAEVQGKSVVIKIADTGAGIKKDHLETLFFSFNRGSLSKVLDFSKPGMGLSLYLAKLIVEAHGGRIDVQTIEGSGSTFTIILPFNSRKI